VDNSSGYYGNALQAAKFRGHIDVVKALLAAGASIGQEGLFSDALSAARCRQAISPSRICAYEAAIKAYRSWNQDEVMRTTSAYCRRPPPSHVGLLSALHPTHYSERTRQAGRANAIEGRDLSFGKAYKSIHDSVKVKNLTKLLHLEHHEQYRSHA
jgi:hypothetical protein